MHQSTAEENIQTTCSGSQPGGGLVGTGDPGLRDAGRIPAILRRQPLRDLREDSEREDRVAATRRPGGEGSHQEVLGAGPHQAARQHEERNRGCEATQVRKEKKQTSFILHQT